jgi:hypothetical protein
VTSWATSRETADAAARSRALGRGIAPAFRRNGTRFEVAGFLVVASTHFEGENYQVLFKKKFYLRKKDRQSLSLIMSHL